MRTSFQTVEINAGRIIIQYNGYNVFAVIHITIGINGQYRVSPHTLGRINWNLFPDTAGICTSVVAVNISTCQQQSRVFRINYNGWFIGAVLVAHKTFYGWATRNMLETVNSGKDVILINE